MNKSRVIIADSSQNYLEGIRGLLETVFDYVIMVADVESLIDAAAKIRADLVVIDLSLGVNQCAGAVKAVKSRFPGLRVLVMSIHDDPTALKNTLAAGAEGFVLKRKAASDLIPAVEAIMKGKKFSSVI